ncbi:MAG TPA: PRC and DUF2382 domain-containing protein [Longimicrobium sp.]|nr:PRC and DUF2382 domain-containing protein [Longimicrobium sp.]
MHNDRLVPLESLPDFHVAEGYTDIRGFDAFLSDGQQVGRVRHLLVDPDAQRVAAVTLHGVGAGGDDMQVPIEDVEIDTPSRRVTVQGAGAGTLGVGDRAAGTAGMVAGAEDLGRRDAGVAGEERITLAEEQLDVQKRRVSAGAVEVQKHVETEHVRESVPLKHEEVTVERHAIADPAVNPNATFEGGEIRVPLTQEEAVVEKRTVANEELVVRTGQVQETQTVEADLRRERAEVIEHGDVRTGGTGDTGLRADNPLRGGRDLDGDGVR